MQKLSIIILSGKAENKTLTNLKSCPVPYEVIVTNIRGLGRARHEAVKKANFELIVQFDDDLVIYPNLWKIILGLQQGEFIMAHVGEHVSTRVFAIHKSDYYRIGGFNPEIMYIFEDGDFYNRALQKSLKAKIVSSDFYSHIDHRPRIMNRWLLVRLSWEHTRFFIKYKKNVNIKLWYFFRTPFDWRIISFHVPVKIVAFFYWFLKGVE
jgi:glycosyltransferase involved in cell wall biosynthesis